MRHSAITFAEILSQQIEQSNVPDLMVCSGMLDLATFLGLAPIQTRATPVVLYMHENQLTYPVPEGVKRDSDAVFKQVTSCLAANEIWWNSAYNLNSFLEALPKYLKRMPDYKLPHVTGIISQKSKVMHLGINPIGSQKSKQSIDSDQPLTITWAARWEHDKNPEDFFKALSILKENNINFALNVIGEQFRSYPKIFDTAKEEFRAEITNWGYLKSRDNYISVLQQSDVVVSTAIHEFFGLSILEAVSAGAFPVLPNRLAYPELFNHEDFFYGQTAQQLAKKLIELSRRKTTQKTLWINSRINKQELTTEYEWLKIAAKLDAQALALTTPHQAHNKY